MDNNKKSVLFGITAGVISFLVVEILFDPSNLLSILIGVVVGIVLTIFLIARSRGEKPTELAKEVVQQAVQSDPGANERRIIEQLVLLNERIRMAMLDMEIIQPCEQLIDLLRNVVPHAQEKFPDTETTFDLEQLATIYLPKLIKEYIDLNLSDRAAQQATLIEQLQRLQEKVTKLNKHLDAGELHEFQVEHGFLNQKF